MFAKTVSIRLKPDSNGEYGRTLEQEILPLLRKQEGFQDAISFVVPGGTRAVGISLWDSKENAKAYQSETYPQVLRALSQLVEGTPKVHTYEVSNSTFHKIASRVTV